MITRIKLNEYTTYINDVNISFENKKHIAKGIFLKGKSGTGKSQLIEAILLLLESTLNTKQINFGIKKSIYTPGMKYNLEYDFLIDDKEINYEIEFISGLISTEYIYVDKKLLYKRTGNKAIKYEEKEKSIENLNMSTSIIKSEYFKTKFEDDEILKSFIKFLKNSIYVNKTQMISFDGEKLEDIIAEKHFIKYGVEDVNKLFQKLKFDYVLSIRNNLLFVNKKGKNEKVPITFESVGNKELVKIIVPIIHLINNNGMILIDSFCESIDLDLQKELFNYTLNKFDKSQLILISKNLELKNKNLINLNLEFDSKRGSVFTIDN